MPFVSFFPLCPTNRCNFVGAFQTSVSSSGNRSSAEKHDRFNSLLMKSSYGCLKLHLGKQIFLLHTPLRHTQILIRYLDEFAEKFGVVPKYQTCVKSASYDKKIMTWHVVACNTLTNKIEEYSPRFLVVATGENSEGYIPQIPGLQRFQGEAIHSSSYKPGGRFNEKRVLIVGSSNSGMEIAYDLAMHGAKTFVMVRISEERLSESVERK